MMSGQFSEFVVYTFNALAVLFVFAVGLVVFVLVCLYISDVTQTKHAIRRNYPVIGRFSLFFRTHGHILSPVFFRHGP